MTGYANVNQKYSGSHLKTDPLRNFKFVVQINNPPHVGLGFSANMGFMSCTGLNVTTEVIPYREGGMNTTTQKMPGQSDFSPITLSKGLMVGPQPMIDWMTKLFTVQQGVSAATSAPGDDFRTTMIIKVLAHPVTGPWGKTGVPVSAAFKVYNAWPTSIAFSDLDAGANAVIVQQMTLAHEGFESSLADSITGSAPQL